MMRGEKGDHRSEKKKKRTAVLTNGLDERRGGRGTHNADIYFIGAGIGEVGFRDSEDRVLGRRFYVAPPRRHRSSSNRPRAAPPHHPLVDRGPRRHGSKLSLALPLFDFMYQREKKRLSIRWKGMEGFSRKETQGY